MKPTLFVLHLGDRALEIHAYGFMVALGAALGVILAVHLGRRSGLATAALLDLCFWALIAGIAGSRLLYVLVHVRDYMSLCFVPTGPRPVARVLADCAAPFYLWKGGLVFYGGALASALVVGRFARKNDWKLGEVADVMAPGLALGHAFGRLGCLFAGCCYGKLCSFGLHFRPASVAYHELAAQGLMRTDAAMTPALAPTQLFEAAGEFAIFMALMLLRRRRRFPGAVVLLYAMAYALLRFIVEVFRGDLGRGYLLELPLPSLAAWLGLPAEQPLLLSSAQALSLVLGGLAAVIYMRRMHRIATPDAR